MIICVSAWVKNCDEVWVELGFTAVGLIRLVKGKGKKGEGNVPLFPSPGREGNQPQGEEGEGKIQGDPLYSPQKI